MLARNRLFALLATSAASRAWPSALLLSSSSRVRRRTLSSMVATVCRRSAAIRLKAPASAPTSSRLRTFTSCGHSPSPSRATAVWMARSGRSIRRVSMKRRSEEPSAIRMTRGSSPSATCREAAVAAAAKGAYGVATSRTPTIESVPVVRIGQ